MLYDAHGVVYDARFSLFLLRVVIFFPVRTRVRIPLFLCIALYASRSGQRTSQVTDSWPGTGPWPCFVGRRRFILSHILTPALLFCTYKYYYDVVIRCRRTLRFQRTRVKTHANDYYISLSRFSISQRRGIFDTIPSRALRWKYGVYPQRFVPVHVDVWRSVSSRFRFIISFGTDAHARLCCGENRWKLLW